MKPEQQNKQCQQMKSSNSFRSHVSSFLVYVKLALKNLHIERYHYDTCGTNNSFRSIVQVTRFIVMNSEKTIMGTCSSNKIYLAYCGDDKQKVMELMQNLRNKLRTTYSVVLVNDGFENATPPVILSYLINFTLVCRLLESGKWIHFGDNMETLIESKFMAFNETINNNKNNPSKNESSSNFFFNCMGFYLKIENYSANKTKNKFGAEIYSIKLYVRIFIQFYKMIPLTEKEADLNMHVYCLPRCVMPASLINIFDAKFDKRFNYKQYWFDVHGYVLTRSAAQTIANVHLYVQEFKYPLGAVLKEAPIKLMKQVEKKHIYIILQIFSNLHFLENVHFESLIFFLPKNENTSYESDQGEFPLLDKWSFDSDVSNETLKEEIKNLCGYDYLKNGKIQNASEGALHNERTKEKGKEMEKETETETETDTEKEEEKQKKKEKQTMDNYKNSMQKINDFSKSPNTINANTYRSYGNIISNNAGQSVDLNFTKERSYVEKNTIAYGHEIKKNKPNIDEFLRNTALTYKLNNIDKATQKNEKGINRKTVEKEKEIHEEIQTKNDNNNNNNKYKESTKDLKQNYNATTKNKETGAKIDNFLNEVARKHKVSNFETNRIKIGSKKIETTNENASHNSGDGGDNFFDGIDEKMLLSKDFQNFLNNIDYDKDISTVFNKVNTVDYTKREQKRPNFKATSEMVRSIPFQQSENNEQTQLSQINNSETNINQPQWADDSNNNKLYEESDIINKRKGYATPKKENYKKLKENN